METGIKDIIEKIKKDGVEKAEEESAKIISSAEETAKKIVNEAEQKAQKIVDDAHKEAESKLKNAEEAMRQAERDVVLSVKKSLTGLFDRVIRMETEKALDTETVKKAIVAMAEKFSPGRDNGVEALLNEKEQEDLEKHIRSAANEQIASGITLKPFPGINKGFRIGKKDDGVYYDLTDEALSEALSVFLSRKLLSVLSSGGEDGR